MKTINKAFWFFAVLAVLIMPATADSDPTDHDYPGILDRCGASSLPIDVDAAEVVIIQPQQFEVTFKIKYNKLTLEEAAKLEKKIRRSHPKACDIKTTLVGENNQVSAVWPAQDFYLTPNIQEVKDD